MTASIISKTDFTNQRLCRLRLANGEKVFIKLILAPSLFLGIWKIGSMNPVTIAADWLMSQVSGRRTAGMIQIWGLGDDSTPDPDAWRLAIKTLFGHEGDDRGILDTVVECILQVTSIQELRERLGFDPQ